MMGLAPKDSTRQSTNENWDKYDFVLDLVLCH